jgi:lipoate-protein ligase A
VTKPLFRYLPYESHDAALNMALDEACMEAVARGDAQPTIRLYRWTPSAVSIGNFQCFSDEVDEQACAAAGIAVVRRLTGGGAVYHDTNGEVTYSVIVPESLVPAGIGESYELLCNILIDAFAELGLAAEFRPVNDIVLDGKKISGNAQTRRGGVVLQHGTILLTVDPARMFSFLTPDKSKLDDKPYIKSVQSAVTSLAEHGITDRARVEHALEHAFRKRFAGERGDWTVRERARAEELVKERYGNVEWNRMR